MDWNDETINRLGVLWDEGHSTAEIGRRMGITKNAVVGKAHRMNLKPRPSPIRWTAGLAKPAVRSAPPISAQPAPPLARPLAKPPAPARSRSVVHPFASPRLDSRNSPCCWPIGEPGTSSFRFCDADATAGKPYCPEHAQLAYVKVRDRRDDAA